MRRLESLRRLMVVLGLLAGCSTGAKPPPEDPTLSRLNHAGDIAFNLERPAQAAEQYRAALDRARVRDDAAAIADSGFNLAAAQLRAGQAGPAMQTARELQAELARRGIKDPAFDLIVATALYRLHEPAAADAVAATLTGGKDVPLANAAWFLRGLIADERGDQPGLEQALAALTPAAEASDVAELRARVGHDPAQALRSADIRRDELDYRGMARALALAAHYTPDAATAADLYLRAGRSAAAQGDVVQARSWLSSARDHATDAALRDEAAHALQSLPAQSS
jgi:hypothetical protein